MNLGTITRIRRYPVKSMGGEEMDAVAVSMHGLAGDRAYALFDPDERKVGSATNTRGFPGLLDLRARYVTEVDTLGSPPPVEIFHRDGRSIRSDAADCADVLSGWIGRRVELGAIHDNPAERPRAGTHAMPGTFFDYAPLHVLTETALASLAAGAPASVVAIERFRPNLVVGSTPAGGYPENDWVGGGLEIGEDLVIDVTDPCPRCAMTTLAQGVLPADPEILKTIARSNTLFTPLLDGDLPCLGVYAFVKAGGIVRLGDVIRNRLRG